MLIDAFLPSYQAHERHEIEVAAPPETVFAALRHMDYRASLVIRVLFALRGLPAFFRDRRARPQPAALGLDLPGLLKSGFILLGEIPNQEIVLGLIGKFWTATGCVQKVTTQQFLEFTTPDFAKAVWNFSVKPLTASRTLLATETRVLCTGERSQRRFRWYWLFVRPFSGWIRMEALRCLKKHVERKSSAAAVRDGL